MTHTPLAAGVEFDIIRGVWRRVGQRAGYLGDDCGFFQVDGLQFAISSDLSIEDRHFRIGWIDPSEIGWRAATAALSDLAAVAASPLGLLVSLGVSSERPREFAAELMEGAADAAEAVGAVIWGGDIAKNDSLVIDVTVLGRVDQDPVRRGGAAVGGALFVTGSLGGASSAIAAWENRREPEQSARQRFARPSARIREAQWLRDRGAQAMIDLSDGLLADAGHIAAASHVMCVLDLDAVPVHASASGAEQATTGGEEYELLVALKDDGSVADDFLDEFDLPLTKVGRVQSGADVRVLRGDEVVSHLVPFKHF